MWKLIKFILFVLMLLLIILLIYSLIFDVQPLTEVSIIEVPIEYD